MKLTLHQLAQKIINLFNHKNKTKNNMLPNRNLEISQEGIDLIKNFEGFSSKVYLCPAGKTTIGYGHVINKNDQTKDPITKKQGEILLKEDLRLVQHYIRNSIKVRLIQGQYDALCSLIYNWGIGNFGNSKGFKFLQQEEYSKAAIEFFDKIQGVTMVNGKISNGLYRRRQAEEKLWQRKS